MDSGGGRKQSGESPGLDKKENGETRTSFALAGIGQRTCAAHRDGTWGQMITRGSVVCALVCDCTFEESGQGDHSDISNVCDLRCPKTVDSFRVKDRPLSEKPQAWDVTRV